MKLGVCPSVEGTNIYPFDKVFDEYVLLYSPAQVETCDAVLLWGGQDIAPIFYGEQPHPMNQQQKGPSQRDNFEWSIMKAAAANCKPIIGVCRGAQFITAFAGGKLNQHMHNHHKEHKVVVSGVRMDVKCDHHQSLNISDLAHDQYVVLAHHPEDNVNEVIYFPKIKALAIQPHPEWQDEDEPFVQWCVSKVKSLVGE